MLRLGDLLGTAAYILLGENRRVAYANLQIAFGDAMPRRRKAWLVRHTFRHFARTILGMFWSKRLGPDDLHKYVEFENVELLREVQARGKGVVIVSMHFHDWELGTLALGWLGAPMTVVTEPTRNPAIERRVSALRTRSGNKAVPPRFALIRTARALQRGELVGMLVDVNGRRNRGGVWLDFFGLPVFNSAAEAVMAQRWGAALLFVHVEPGAEGKTRIVFGPEIPHASSGDFAADVKTVGQECVRRCEQLIRGRPEHWLWTYKRWKRRPTPEVGAFPFYSRHTPV
jgi:KDO2-lipid IV(A) lauroyltransferase